MSTSVKPGYHSGQRLASLKSATASCGEAFIWAGRRAIAMWISSLYLGPAECRRLRDPGDWLGLVCRAIGGHAHHAF